MSVSLDELLANLAVSQAVVVAPGLGESYSGKSAGTIAGILMMLAQDARGYSERRTAARAAVEAILASAPIDDRALADDIALLLRQPADADTDAETGDPLDRLLIAFTLVHAWADEHDPALARRCRRFLVDWTARDVLAPPALPGA
jgi:hypothetical protein